MKNLSVGFSSAADCLKRLIKEKDGKGKKTEKR
jgi:hypothetical protein